MNYTYWSYTGNLLVREVTLHYQQFPVIVRQPSDLECHTYSGNQKRATEKFYPGTVLLNNANVYRGESVILTPSYSPEGVKYGARYEGYRIVYPGGGKSDVFYSDRFELTSSFIATHIYGRGGTYWGESLHIEPVFTRTNAGNIQVLGYSDAYGELKIDGQKYKDATIPANGRQPSPGRHPPRPA